jgi:hypothetical protein
MEGRFWTGVRPAESRRAGPPASTPVDQASVVALLEAINVGDPAAIFRRAVEKDMRELIARSRRLEGQLTLAPEVAGPILAAAVDHALSPVVCERA